MTEVVANSVIASCPPDIAPIVTLEAHSESNVKELELSMKWQKLVKIYEVFQKLSRTCQKFARIEWRKDKVE